MGQAKLSILATAVVLGLTGCGGSSSSVDDTREPTNTAPVAEAGSAQDVATGTEVSLSGAGSSDADGDSLTYTWAFTSVPSGSDATLSGASAVSAAFTPDVDGEYIVSLVVNDGTVNSASDTVVVTATAANTAPVADAGADQNVPTSSVVTLNGGDSTDADGDSLTFSWSFSSQPAGSTAELSNAASASPTFTPDVDGEYTIALTVNDGTTDSESDDVIVTASTENSAPVAEAGATQNVTLATLVTLDGSASSDADGDTLTYSWTIASAPEANTAVLGGATTAAPTFTPDAEGEYVVSLIVNDGTVDSAEDSVTINVASGNSAPVANAGEDQNVATGDTVQLDGAASTDSDNDALTYAWSFVSKPTDSTATLNDDTAADPTFTADLAGSYVLSLVVNDGTVSSAADNVQIEAVDPRVRLFRKSGSSDTYNEFSVSSQFAGNFSREVSDPPPESVTLVTLKLLAEGGDFTVTNVSASDSRNVVVPFFTGIENGTVLTKGTEVIVTLDSPPTGGQATSLTYTFEIEETGETFLAVYQFSTTTP
ncbi:PKD domain-containing protein [Alteromonas sp. RKMC-009]|uniref:PKD domain-containing protein n=1 Tax=Alteromonas sp. RKMC-009 TaxID=2267264 RepID=UPI000E683AE8|nr:PKD domain-containing protein [Alteromonas sp. RKMC-009]AYA63330.1 hypothetical protein DS731_04545 [Alteromonas sp. RKMC-009]